MKKKKIDIEKALIIGTILMAASPLIVEGEEKSLIFPREFAPSEDWVKQPEKPFRQSICLNGKWDFQPVYGPYEAKNKNGNPFLSAPETDGWDSVKIKIPSPWNVNSFTIKSATENEYMGGDFLAYPSYPNQWNKAKMGWHRKFFSVPSNWKGKRVVLTFKAVAGKSQVVINGKDVAGNFDSTLPFNIDVTDYINFSEKNELLVGVIKHQLFNKKGKYGKFTYATGSFWQMHIAGIWQDVFLTAYPDIYISDAYVMPDVSLNKLSVTVTVTNTTEQDHQVDISGVVSEWINLTDKDVLSAPEIKWKLGKKALNLSSKKVVVPAGCNVKLNLSTPVDGKLKYWNLKDPNLYGLIVRLSQRKDIKDVKYQRFGWREFKISGKDFTLNGEKIQFLGDAWHFMGIPQMTRRYAWSWYKMVQEAGGNAVRLHAMVYPEFYLDMADEMGIAILDETSIWASHCAHNYDSGLLWKSFAENAKGLVLRDRNHACIFGWSVANEIRPALNVVCKDQEYKNNVYDKFVDLINIFRENDSTRDWLSIDGDHDLDGRLPVNIAHYGTAEDYLRQAEESTKPYGVGEGSIGYYGTPSQAAKFIGDRAYRSFEDRMDAVAIDSYELIAKGQRPSASYCSTFNLAWYGNEALPLGMKDISRKPQPTDGIFFKEYIEGKPGAQPERLGPYTTTFNPGYDPSLPLYKPWALFHAVKAAYATPPQPCEWDRKETTKLPPAPVYAKLCNEVLYIGDKNTDIFIMLGRCGIPILKDGSYSEITIIDANTFINSKSLKNTLRKSVEKGGNVIVWNVNPENVDKINAILPLEINVFPMESTSFVHNESDNRVASIPLEEMYFTEDTSYNVAMRYAIEGELVNKGNVLLKACPTDWRQWNFQGEDDKIARIIRSERERPQGAAFVEFKRGKGAYFVSTIESDLMNVRLDKFIQNIFKNIGVKINFEQIKNYRLPELSQVLVSPVFETDNYDQALDEQFIPITMSAYPKKNKFVGGHKWSLLDANQGIFDLKKLDSTNPATIIGAVYLSFWAKSPKPLNELLADPDIPKVSFKFGSDDGCVIWLNDEKIFENRGCHPMVADQFSIDELPLRKGWNHFVVKVAQKGGEWRFSGRLKSANREIISKIKWDVEPIMED